MNCIYCGAALQEGSVICSRCGKRVQMVKDIDALEDEYLTGILEQGQQNRVKEPSAREKRKKQEQLKRAKKRRTQRIVVSVVLVVLLIAGIAAGFYVESSINAQHEQSYEYQLAKADEAYANGSVKEAIDYYEKALALEPDHKDVRLKLAQIYYDRKDYDSAQILYQQTVEDDPLNAESYRMLISIYEKKNKTDEILALCRDVTDPDILALFSDYIVNAPGFSADGGTYSDYMEISISSDAGHQIYYTMDGTDPSVYGRLYKEPLALNTMGTYTVRAVCVNAKKIYSDIITEVYVIDIPAPGMPVVTPNGGNFEEETPVSISVPDGCTAYYTWDGTIPNTTSDKYKEKLVVPEGNNILSVLMVDDRTGKWSDIYRGRFVYYPASEEIPVEEQEEATADQMISDGSDEDADMVID
jgi:predicted negative regulator of RcsB-dependent stress response